jgi:hypothetical protein
VNEHLQTITHTVTAWDLVASAPHRFGGIEFMLGNVEIGHIHIGGLVDIPFTRMLAQQLIEDGLAEPHHVLPETGWISFYIRKPDDVAHALRLYRLSYLQKRLARSRRDPELANAIRNELKTMKTSDKLRALLIDDQFTAGDGA